jgi:hypothetical protein
MSLTAAGGRLLARAVPIWETTHAAIEALLADRGPAQAVGSAADRLRRNLRALS